MMKTAMWLKRKKKAPKRCGGSSGKSVANKGPCAAAAEETTEASEDNKKGGKSSPFLCFVCAIIRILPLAIESFLIQKNALRQGRALNFPPVVDWGSRLFGWQKIYINYIVVF